MLNSFFFTNSIPRTFECAHVLRRQVKKFSDMLFAWTNFLKFTFHLRIPKCEINNIWNVIIVQNCALSAFLLELICCSMSFEKNLKNSWRHSNQSNSNSFYYLIFQNCSKVRKISRKRHRIWLFTKNPSKKSQCYCQ